MTGLSGKEILLGVSGSVAAYKSAEIVRALRKSGAGVTCVMTPAARRFISPLTLQALSGRRVVTDMFDPANPDDSEPHITLTETAAVILLAPATADLIARLACGLADDVVTALCLAAAQPVVVAPAMHTRMWTHPATRNNVSLLKERGYRFVGPERGTLADFSVGEGHLAPLARILSEVSGAVRNGPGPGIPTQAGGALFGKRVLVSAGPTREPLDPVRFFSNASTGRMGYALAAAAREEGAAVTLVTGPTHLSPPKGVRVVRVRTAAEMQRAMLADAAQADLIIGAAAVSDYAPRPSPVKLIKTAPRLQVRLNRTPDILSEIGSRSSRAVRVGFSLDTHDRLARARLKLRAKRLDFIVANSPKNGLGTETNRILLLNRNGRVERWKTMPKPEVARRLMKRFAETLARSR